MRTLVARCIRALLVLVLLARPALAQPESSVGIRRLELTLQGQSSQVVRMKPGRPLTFLFDSSLGEDIHLAEREDFERVEATEGLLLLLPAPSLRVGQHLRLRVPFRGEQAPLAAELSLEVVDTEEDTLVRVYRNARSAASLSEELKEEKRRREELQTENGRLRRTLQSLPGGLVAVAAGGAVDDVSGVHVQKIIKGLRNGPGSVLNLGQNAYSYRTANGAAVKVRVLSATGEAQPRMEAAVLRAGDGRVLQVTTVWQSEWTQANGGVDVIVESEPPPVKYKGDWTLELEAAEGAQRFTLEGIVFPSPPD